MVTKGVASVRSPVCNLQQFNVNVSHGDFSDAVVKAFQDEYGVDQEVCVMAHIVARFALNNS